MRITGSVLAHARHPIKASIGRGGRAGRAFAQFCEQHPVLGEWIGFTVWETLSTGVFYAVLLLLMGMCGFAYLSAVAVAFLPSVAADFTVQRNIIFHSDPKRWRGQLAWFILKELLLYAAGTLIVEVGVERFALWYLPVQLTATVGIGLVSFLGSLRIFQR